MHARRQAPSVHKMVPEHALTNAKHHRGAHHEECGGPRRARSMRKCHDSIPRVPWALSLETRGVDYAASCDVFPAFCARRAVAQGMLPLLHGWGATGDAHTLERSQSQMRSAAQAASSTAASNAVRRSPIQHHRLVSSRCGGAPSTLGLPTSSARTSFAPQFAAAPWGRPTGLKEPLGADPTRPGKLECTPKLHRLRESSAEGSSQKIACVPGGWALGRSGGHLQQPTPAVNSGGPPGWSTSREDWMVPEGCIGGYLVAWRILRVVTHTQ